MSPAKRARSLLERALQEAEAGARIDADRAAAVASLAQAALAIDELERRHGPAPADRAAAKRQLLRCAAVLEGVTTRRGRLAPEGPIDADFEPTPGKLQELRVAPPAVDELEARELLEVAAAL
jgi:hypothetical protein